MTAYFIDEYTNYIASHINMAFPPFFLAFQLIFSHTFIHRCRGKYITCSHRCEFKRRLPINFFSNCTFLKVGPASNLFQGFGNQGGTLYPSNSISQLQPWPNCLRPVLLVQSSSTVWIGAQVRPLGSTSCSAVTRGLMLGLVMSTMSSWSRESTLVATNVAASASVRANHAIFDNMILWWAPRVTQRLICSEIDMSTLSTLDPISFWRGRWIFNCTENSINHNPIDRLPLFNQDGC